MSLRDSIRIMVIDDMSVSRALITQSLEELGITKYLTENDGNTALGKLVGAPVHLVLCDMNMPGMNGLELLHALRSYKTTARVGFILITGQPTPELLKIGQELGLNNLIRKPFTTATMKASIERVVGPL